MNSHTPSERPPRLAVLLSGGGRTLDNLLAAINRGQLHAEVAMVVGSRECRGIDKARHAGLPTQVIRGEIDESTLSDMLTSRSIDLVVLAGYLSKVHVPHGYEDRVVNIHPALLPDFGGHGMYGDRVHRAVIETGATESGCTVHYCDAEYDTGEIILQARCQVATDDTPETLAARVFELECALYPEAIAIVLDRITSGRSRENGS